MITTKDARCLSNGIRTTDVEIKHLKVVVPIRKVKLIKISKLVKVGVGR